jgi:hypothetical protein
MPTDVHTGPAAEVDPPTATFRRRLWIVGGVVAVLVLTASAVVLIERHRSAQEAERLADSMILMPAAKAAPVGTLRQLTQQVIPLGSAGPQASWGVVAASPTSAVVRVGWVGGDAPSCVAADTALVTEEASRVVIQLTDHPTVDQCNADAVSWMADVALSRPLGDRTLLEYVAPGG